MSEPTDQAAVRPLPRKRAVRGATEAARLAAEVPGEVAEAVAVRPKSRVRRPRSIQVVEIAVLPVRDLVLFPHMVSPLPVGRPRSLRAI